MCKLCLDATQHLFCLCGFVLAFVVAQMMKRGLLCRRRVSSLQCPSLLAGHVTTLQKKLEMARRRGSAGLRLACVSCSCQQMKRCPAARGGTLLQSFLSSWHLPTMGVRINATVRFVLMLQLWTIAVPLCWLSLRWHGRETNFLKECSLHLPNASL